MATTYNIYKINKESLNEFKKKISSTDLVEQKSKNKNGFSSTFYYSENAEGNDVWWWDTYKDYIKDKDSKPKNVFHYGLLISIPNAKESRYFYVVSLGKSHFYLSKFIERDFGINLAMNIADESSTLLKKSTYYSNVKKAEVASYQKFVANSYEPGESVDHLKLKALDAKIWGDKNIICSDSIQLVFDQSPNEISKILWKIENVAVNLTPIKLPKLEMVKSDLLTSELDAILLDNIKKNDINFSVSEFEVLGPEIIMTQDSSDFEIFTRKGNESFSNRKILGQTLDKSDIVKYITNLDEEIDLNDIKIKFSSESSKRRTKKLKESIEFSTSHQGISYAIRNGLWYQFNDTFIEYLKKSLNSIPIFKKANLIEADYLIWKGKKEKLINKRKTDPSISIDDEITYREYWFNKEMSNLYGYKLLDRKNQRVKSISEKGRDYLVEAADLHKDMEFISLKISDDASNLIYNIAQSISAIELFDKNLIDAPDSVSHAGLWFVFERAIDNITDINSIQFLLSLQNWKKRVEALGYSPVIYISQHVKV